MQLHKLRTLLCSQASHARTSQNIVSGRERAATTDVSRIVAVAHTTMSIGMDNTTKTINQPLVRKRSKTTLGEVVGKSWYFVKTTNSQTNTHTASARRPQHMLDLPHWAFRGGLHRRLARPCSLKCVQTQTNHKKPYRYLFFPLYIDICIIYIFAGLCWFLLCFVFCFVVFLWCFCGVFVVFLWCFFCLFVCLFVCL